MTENQSNQAVQFIRATLAPLTVPIREFLLGVGHSTVAAATIIGICVIASTWVWSIHFERVNEPATMAMAEERLAHARWYELSNLEKETKSPVRQWSLAAFNATEAGLSVEFGVVENAQTLRVVVSVDGAEKIVSAPIVDPISGVSRAAWTPAQLAPAWKPSGQVTINGMEQLTPDTPAAKYVGARRSLQIPP